MSRSYSQETSTMSSPMLAWTVSTSPEAFLKCSVTLPMQTVRGCHSWQAVRRQLTLRLLSVCLCRRVLSLYAEADTFELARIAVQKHQRAPWEVENALHALDADRLVGDDTGNDALPLHAPKALLAFIEGFAADTDDVEALARVLAALRNMAANTCGGEKSVDSAGATSLPRSC